MTVTIKGPSLGLRPDSFAIAMHKIVVLAQNRTNLVLWGGQNTTQVFVFVTYIQNLIKICKNTVVVCFKFKTITREQV